MLEKPFATIIGILVMTWIGWILIASGPDERITRGCAPVSWVGNVIESAAAMASPTSIPVIKEGFENWTYGCRFAVWRQFFEKDYLISRQAFEQAKKHGHIPAEEDMSLPVEPYQPPNQPPKKAPTKHYDLSGYMPDFSKEGQSSRKSEEPPSQSSGSDNVNQPQPQQSEGNKGPRWWER